VIYKHGYGLGYKGIVSTWLSSRWRFGRSPHWVKAENPWAPGTRERQKRQPGGRSIRGVDRE